ncbi:MAG: hypothetical protein AAF989_01760, partial [Planctomycetota bacterium]
MKSALTLIAMMLATNTHATDWLTLPSTYSHDPISGQRVSQYAPAAQPAAPVEASFRSSGYRQHRSTLSYGRSADNYHRVETWGDPVRPYGEWRFPYRPYSTPYPNWGQPYGGLNLGYYGRPFAPGTPFPGGRQYAPQPGNPAIPATGFRPNGADQANGPATDPPTPVQRPRRRGEPLPPVFADPANPYPAGGASPYPV